MIGEEGGLFGRSWRETREVEGDAGKDQLIGAGIQREVVPSSFWPMKVSIGFRVQWPSLVSLGTSGA